VTANSNSEIRDASLNVSFPSGIRSHPGFGFWKSGFRIFLALSLTAPATCLASAEPNPSRFREAASAYHAGDFSEAATLFRETAAQHPSAGALQNLGNAEWQRGRIGAAILAWEQTLWLDPWNEAARNNLRFARREGQIESPELAWHEALSSWLPSHAWAWTTAVSLWLVATMLIMPRVFRWRKTAWPQALAAVGITFFLLSIPAHFGVAARSRVAFVLSPQTSLLLTPTQEAQEITRLGSGDPVRCVRKRGNYFYVRLGRGAGWVDQGQIGFVSPW
jgi:tetratricopeptide (TPR) repeat protein